MAGIRRFPLWSARSAQKFGGKINKNKNKNMKRWKWVRATTTLLPCANSSLNLRTLSHFTPWNKPIHGLELFYFATVSPVLPTGSNTLDRSRHFEPGTFLNRHHCRDVWYLHLHMQLCTTTYHWPPPHSWLGVCDYQNMWYHDYCSENVTINRLIGDFDCWYRMSYDVVQQIKWYYYYKC